MIRRLALPSLSLVGVLLAGCQGSTGESRERPKRPPSAADSGSPSSDAGEPGLGAWFTLLKGDWQLDPGEEAYFCARKTLDRELYVDAWDGVQPLGTHHTVLTMGTPDFDDGVSRCSAMDNRQLTLYATGVGSQEFDMPAGIAMKLPAGQQVLLNLHLFNTGDAPLTGTSGIRARAADPAAVEHEAGLVLAGTNDIKLPPQSETTISGTCTLTQSITIFAAAAHMHQKGTYLRAVAHSSEAGDTVLNDAPYSFDNQVAHLVDPLVMNTGDTVAVDCTYRNDSSDVIHFGTSSKAEMCYVGLLHYPSLGVLSCTD